MPATILILSEDGATEAHATVRALARRMLRLIEPGYREQDVDFLPLHDELARQSVLGNRWDSREPRFRQPRIALMRTLVTRLLASETSFVFYHIDGDQRWARRAQSEKIGKFARFLDEAVRNNADERTPGRDAMTLATTCRERLFLLTPFYRAAATHETKKPTNRSVLRRMKWS